MLVHLKKIKAIPTQRVTWNSKFSHVPGAIPTDTFGRFARETQSDAPEESISTEARKPSSSPFSAPPGRGRGRGRGGMGRGMRVMQGMGGK